MQSQCRGITKQMTTENYNPYTNVEPKAKCREDQSCLDCRLVRAFVAQPIKEHTCTQ